MQSWEDQLVMLWCTSDIDSPFGSWLSHRSRLASFVVSWTSRKSPAAGAGRILDFSRTSKENIKMTMICDTLWYYHDSIDITKCFKVFGSVGSVGCFSRSEPSAIALLVHLLERAVASFPNRLLGLSNFDIKFQISTNHRFSYKLNTQAFTLTRDWCSMCHRWKRAFAPPSVSKKLRRNANWQSNKTPLTPRKSCVGSGVFLGLLPFWIMLRSTTILWYMGLWCFRFWMFAMEINCIWWWEVVLP